MPTLKRVTIAAVVSARTPPRARRNLLAVTLAAQSSGHRKQWVVGSFIANVFLDLGDEYFNERGKVRLNRAAKSKMPTLKRVTIAAVVSARTPPRARRNLLAVTLAAQSSGHRKQCCHRN